MRAIAVSPADHGSDGAMLGAKTHPATRVDSHSQVQVTCLAQQGAGNITSPVAEIQLARPQGCPGFFDQLVAGED